MKISTSARNGACDAVVDLLDGGSGAGTLEIWAGSIPAAPSTSITDGAGGYDLLAVLTFSDPAFGNAATGTATANSITGDASVNKTGTATFFRAKDSDGNVILQGSCGTSGADLNWDSTSFVVGGTADVTSLTVTVPEGS